MVVKKELICINCPMGCRIEAVVNDGEIESITGNTCFKGGEYARQELTHPMRTVTGLVRAEGGNIPVPVKTETAVPKELVLEVADALRAVTVDRPVKAGDVIIRNICGSGVNVVATADIE